MVRLGFQSDTDEGFTILCLGAHSDDIEIGCGGTVLRLLEEYPDVRVHWVVFGSDGEERTSEALRGAGSFLERAKHKDVVVKNYRDGFFPYIGAEIKEYFEVLKREIDPTIIFTHYRYDLHQDHRLLAELTWNTFRKHLILEYEIFKYDGDLGNPNFYVHLHEEVCQKKIDNILHSFRSQLTKSWFSKESFFALLRLRGIESNAPQGYAEAFYCRKSVY